uniref:Legume lectin domain-containing protein n=1 Tax=Nelumbo nucifera TaxID=4432 RepID=A0A822Y9N5_NELNU|nr:TPA_asm: hypothetical protein HUJ06_029739 [Nelumbo nucifera]
MRHFPVSFTIELSSLFLFPIVAASENVGFTFNGFRGANLSLGGLARITPNGLLMMTNVTRLQTGHYFYPYPLHFKNPSEGEAVSFSSTFVFAIVPEPEYPNLSGHGIVFVIAPSRDLPGSLASQYLGLFNVSNNGNPSNHVVAVEVDTNQNKEFADINGNHVGIDINSLKSVDSKPASYFTDENGGYKNLSLKVCGSNMMLSTLELMSH